MGVKAFLQAAWTAWATTTGMGPATEPLSTLGPQIFIQTVPRTPPESDSQVFRFSVRGPEQKTDDVVPLASPSLVSSPKEWVVSLEDRGTSLYSYDRSVIGFEHKGAIVATFQVFRYGLKDLRIVLKTTAAADITCWGGGPTSPTYDHASVVVANRRFITAAGFLREAGLSIFLVNRHKESIQTDDPLLFGSRLPLYWTKVDAKTHEYYIGGHEVDVYLSIGSPAKGNRDFLKFLWGITGKPRVPPPAYALGFMASRWGWESREYISKVLDTFDINNVPLDAFIMDFEWYLNITGGDYLIPTNGLADYPDFSLGNKKTFPDIRTQAKEYRARNVKFGGIRKPRLGDMDLLALAQQNGWLLSKGPSGKVRTRDLNFAIPEVREWYANQTINMLTTKTESLPDFFWNDEGETSYFTYHHWIEAQQLASPSTNSAKRRFSLNRGFTPGCQRLESFSVWTGDVPTTWESLRQNVDMLVRWSEAGVPLVAFDIGGFAGPQPNESYPEVLVRWYQLGAFAGVMRVHSTLENTPHFPFPELWGKEAAGAMRSAVHMRYTLLPTIISTMYQMRDESIPWVERNTYDRHDQATDFLFANRTIFVAPIVQPLNTSQSRSIEFPPESKAWYPLFQRKEPANQMSKVAVDNLALTDVLVYARAGSIVLLHGTDISEASRVSEIIGGRHDLLVYIFASPDPDASIAATLVEDDGETYNKDKVRTTQFSFNQRTSELQWKTTGSQTAPRWYDQARIVYRQLDGSEVESTTSLEATLSSILVV